MKKSGGRNNQGHLTSRHRGGGHKRQYRKIDFKRNKFGIPGRVAEIEYDPNRTARIALVVYADGEKRYILHPKGLSQGDTVVSGPGSDTRTGNALPLGEIPLGTNGAQHRAQDRQGRPALPNGGLQRPGGREGGRVRHPPPPLHRDAPGARPLPRHCRRGRERGARAALRGQGGQEPLAGQAAQGPRRSHEPGRSPAGRRRGQELRRPSRRCPPGASPRAARPVIGRRRPPS